MIDHEIRNPDDGGPRRVTCKHDECDSEVFIMPGESEIVVEEKTHDTIRERHYCTLEHAGLDTLERSETTETTKYKWKARIDWLKQKLVVGVLE